MMACLRLARALPARGTVARCAAVLLMVVAWVARADTVTVAVASNFAVPMRDIASAYETETGHSVRIATGATGALYAQIVNGAPYDLFLAADTERPERLVAEGLAADRRPYATGRLVLWTREAGVTVNAASLADIGDDTRLAVANALTAPYGRAALEVIRALAPDRALGARLVVGQNVAQCYQFAATGNVRFAFLARSLVYRDGAILEGSGWLVPEALHTPVRQDAVLLRRAAGSEAARRLFEYLGSDASRRVLQRYGYGPG